jgi:DNA-binding NarL/FixJ family response regulator
LIVDDSAGFRTSAAELLEAEGFDVVGAAEDADEAVELTLRMRPEIVLLDVQLPDRDGFAVATRLAQEVEPPQVVLISSRDAIAYGRRLADAPVRGFIAKRDLTGAALAALVTERPWPRGAACSGRLSRRWVSPPKRSGSASATSGRGCRIC